MVTVVLLIHLMIAAALVAVVLLQRSEGGALGIGGGGGGFLTGRGTANLLTRLTAGLAAAFFLTSTILSLMAQRSAPPSVFDQPATEAPAAPGQDSTSGGGVLDRLQSPGTPSVPQDR
ncbi:MAG: preprotein translocase subunit SecG [Pseudomonadota bacterium]|jgi:preprotein translocase subunit SecG|nr:MAG: preprotein translocase subunit SecG [Pseudomonadota bacterium]